MMNRWIVWSIVTLFYAYQYVLRVLPSIVMPDIVGKFSLSPEAFGQYSGVYYLGYSLAHIPVGICFDRFPIRKAVPFFLFMIVLGLLPLILADLWIYPILGRILIGIGSSGAVLSVFKVIQIAFDEKQFSRILSMTVTIGLIGAMYGGGPVQILKDTFGFKAIIIGLSLTGSALAVLSYLLIPSQKMESKRGTILADISSIIRNKKIISLCLLAGLMVGPLEGFADVWGVNFLAVVYQLDEKVAASLPSLIFMGMCFGGPVLCYLTEVKKKHLEVITLAAIWMGLAFCCLLAFKLNTVALTFLFLSVGVFCVYQILVIHKVATLAPASCTGLATAMSNMIIMIFGYVFHSVIGKIVGTFGDFRDPYGLTLGIAVIPLSLGLGAIGMLFLKRRFSNASQTSI